MIDNEPEKDIIKQAVEVLSNRYQGIKGLTIIEVDVYPAITPPTK